MSKLIITTDTQDNEKSYTLVDVSDEGIVSVYNTEYFLTQTKFKRGYMLSKFRTNIGIALTEEEVAEDIDNLLKEDNIDNYKYIYPKNLLSDIYNLHTKIYQEKLLEKNIDKIDNLFPASKELLKERFLMIKEVYLLNLLNEYKRKSRTSQDKIWDVQRLLNRHEDYLHNFTTDLLEIIIQFKTMFLKDEEFLYYVENNIFEGIEDFLTGKTDVRVNDIKVFESLR